MHGECAIGSVHGALGQVRKLLAVCRGTELVKQLLS